MFTPIHTISSLLKRHWFSN